MINQVFASFPVAGAPGAYQRIDVNAIEAIGQSAAPTVATIFVNASERYYQVEIPQEWLDGAEVPDAASWIESSMHQAIEEQFELAKASILQAPTGPATFHGDLEMPL